MQTPEESSGMCVDYCLFLPISSSQSNADSSPEPQQDATWVLFNCCRATPLSLPGPSGDLCSKEVLLFYNLRFQNSFSPPSMGVYVCFAPLLAWKCISAAIPCRKLKEGEDATCRWVPSQKSYFFFLLSLLHPDVQDTLFCTPELPQRRSDPSLQLPQEVYHLPSGFIFLRWVA